MARLCGSRERFAIVYILFFLLGLPEPVAALNIERGSSMVGLRRDVSGTLEIPFQISRNVETGEIYYFNCTIGSPPLIVNMSIRLTAGDMQISRTVSNDSLSKARFNPSLSSSFKSNALGVNYNLKADSLTRSGANPRNVLEVEVVYASDEISFGGVKVEDMAFVSSSSALFESSGAQGSGVDDVYPFYWLGLGLEAGQSARWTDTQGKGTPYPTFPKRFVSQGIINSNTYSIYTDAADQSSGHLLLGAVNTARYKGSLIDLSTSLKETGDQWGLKTQRQLTVALSYLSINNLKSGSGGRATPIQGSISDLVLSHEPACTFPPTIARQIWDAVGATYSKTSDPTTIKPSVPCSFLTNTSTLDIKFSGAPNLTLPVPMSYLTQRDGNGMGCTLLVAAGEKFQDSALSIGAMRNLYTVYDLENKKIAIALTDHTAQEDNIIPIPATGVSGMQLLASAQKATSGTTMDMKTSKWLIIILGIALPILVVISTVCVFVVWRKRKIRRQREIRQQAKQEAYAEEYRLQKSSTRTGDIVRDWDQGDVEVAVQRPMPVAKIPNPLAIAVVAKKNTGGRHELDASMPIIYRKGDVLPVAGQFETRYELP